MKSISGSILDSKQITLSKAASSMNNFLSIETGASTAVSSYLRRCAAAFNELVQHHKELKSERKHKHNKKSHLQTLENGNVVERRTDLGEEEEEEESVRRYQENSGLGSIDEEGRTMEMMEKKKKKRKRSDEIERESGGGIEVEEIKKKKKKRKKPEIEDECLDDSEERHTKKKKKRKHERGNLDDVEAMQLGIYSTTSSKQSDLIRPCST